MYYCDDFVSSYFDEIEDDMEANRAAVERVAARARERREARRQRLGFMPRVCWADGSETSCAATDDAAQPPCRETRRRRCECMCCNGCGKNNGGCSNFSGHWCAACEEWRCARCIAPCADHEVATQTQTCRYCLRML
jgi:hypothetical protein